MKSMLIASALAVAALTTLGEGMSLADARGQIDAVVAEPAKATAVMRSLSAEDQKAFLADLNAAIARMPGSGEAKAAAFVAVNRAVLKGAQKGNLSTLLAECFATVTPEALTVVSENFASGLFNRAADPSHTFTDEAFVKIAKDNMAKIHARNASTGNSAVRDVFAVLMFVRASNGSPKDLADTLLADLDAETRETAKKDWLPAALAEGEAKSYEPMLAVADAGHAPNVAVTMRLTDMSGVAGLDTLLNDLRMGPVDENGYKTMPLTASTMPGARMGFMPHSNVGGGVNRMPMNNSRSILYTEIGSMGDGRQVGGGPAVTKTWTQAPSGAKIDEATGRVTTADGTVICEKGGKVDEKGNILLPPGVIVAPGGTPVSPGPNPQPVGPGGRVITPTVDPVEPVKPVEPGGYDSQY